MRARLQPRLRHLVPLVVRQARDLRCCRLAPVGPEMLPDLVALAGGQQSGIKAVNESFDGRRRNDLKTSEQDLSGVSTQLLLLLKCGYVLWLELVTVNNLASGVVRRAKEVEESAPLRIISTKEGREAKRELECRLRVRAENRLKRADGIDEAIGRMRGTVIDRREVHQRACHLPFRFLGRRIELRQDRGNPLVLGPRFSAVGFRP